MREWLTKIEEHLSHNNTVDLVNHVGEDHLEADNERAGKVNKMCHRRGLKAIKDCTGLCRTSTGGERYRENVFETLA
jgi:hypothetical protein